MAVHIGDGKLAFAREQLCGGAVSPTTREHEIRNAVFAVMQ
jgi:hypothetical protein